MSNVTEVIKTLKLDTSGIPDNKKRTALKDASEVLVNEIIRYLDRGESPVQGEKKFKILSPDYAKREKGGRRISNLQLKGDLLEALKAVPKNDSTIEVGVKGKEAPKADGHNQLSLEAKLWAQDKNFPKRRFIPDNTQTFKKDIITKLNQVLDSYRESEKEAITVDEFMASEVTDYIKPTAQIEAPEKTEVVFDFFDDNALEDLVEDILRRRK